MGPEAAPSDRKVEDGSARQRAGGTLGRLALTQLALTQLALTQLALTQLVLAQLFWPGWSWPAERPCAGPLAAPCAWRPASRASRTGWARATGKSGSEALNAEREPADNISWMLSCIPLR